MKFHNNANGPQPCRAHVRTCPLGGEHFDSQTDAQHAYDVSMADSHGLLATVKKNPRWGGGRLALRSTKRPEMDKLAQVKHQRRRKNLTRAAMIAASLALLTSCSDGNSANWADDPVPKDSYSAPAEPGEKLLGDKVGDLKDKAQGKYTDLKDTYENDWKDNIDDLKNTYGNDWQDNVEDYLVDFLEYAQTYEAPDSHPTESHSAYDRAAFKHWTDTNLYNNNCDTRQDVLQRDLENVVLASDGCIQSGTLQDPYTGETITYERGDLSIDIDHVVSLGDSWGKGSEKWSDAQREAFANDPENLLAVDAGANRSKSDSSPSEWMPINQSQACSYSMQYLQVAKKYELRIDSADVAAADLACK